MDECLFCKIASGETDTPLVYETEDVAAFDDINPAGPVHVLVVPKKHYASLDDLDYEALGGKLLAAAADVARIKGVDKSGYRTIINTGADSGQVVYHVHVHVIGGKRLGRMG